MSNRVEWAGILLVVSLFFSSGELRAGELPQPVTWIPASANRIIFLDWAELVASPSLRELEKTVRWQETWPQLEEFRDLTGMDPWQDLWALSAFSAASESASNWGLAAYGAFDRTRVVDTIESRRTVGKTTHREIDVYLINSANSVLPRFGEEGAALAFPDDSTALYGPASQVRAMLDAGLGFGPAVSSGPLASRLRERSEAEAFWVVGRDETGVRRHMDTPLSSNLPPMRSFAIAVRVGTAVSIAATGETAGPEQATAVADVLRGVKAMQLLHPEGNDALAAILASLEIETLDDTVEVSVEVDSKALRGLLALEKNDQAEPGVSKR